MSVLCFGEILIDDLGGLRLAGGGPANVACHASAIGGRAALVSRVGSDTDGGRLAAWLQRRGVGTRFLQSDESSPTGVVRVLPGPSYEIAAPAAWDFISLSNAAREAATKAGAVVFGTLAQRHPTSRKTIRALVEAARSAGVPALCDLNLRVPFYDEETVVWCLRNCDVLKLNRGELEIVSRLLRAHGETEDLFPGLLREFAVAGGVLTDGEKGAWIFQDGRVRHQPAEQTGTFSDAVGAGDAFSAVLAVALARGIPIAQAAAPAAQLAAFVVSRAGATPEIPHALGARIRVLLGV